MYVCYTSCCFHITAQITVMIRVSYCELQLYIPGNFSPCIRYIYIYIHPFRILKTTKLFLWSLRKSIAIETCVRVLNNIHYDCISFGCKNIIIFFCRCFACYIDIYDLRDRRNGDRYNLRKKLIFPHMNLAKLYRSRFYYIIYTGS